MCINKQRRSVPQRFQEDIGAYNASLIVRQTQLLNNFTLPRVVQLYGWHKLVHITAIHCRRPMG